MSRYYHCEYDHQNKLRQYLQKRGLIPNLKQHSQAQQNAHARQARKPGITNEDSRKDTAQRKQYGTQRQYYFESMEVCGHQRNRQTDDSHKLPQLIQYFIYIQAHRLVLSPHKNITQQVAHNGIPQKPHIHAEFCVRPTPAQTTRVSNTQTYPHNKNIFPLPASRFRRVFRII